jgi:hypothetical protein
MSSRDTRDIRLSQTVAPFGVGAIYDFRGESLIAMDVTHWREHGDRVRLDRLAQELGVAGFRSAPRSRKGSRLPFLRFPRWLFCPTCRRMVFWKSSQEQPDKPACCSSCSSGPQLVPMRFVVVCDDGHLGDVWWGRWAHSAAKPGALKQCRGENKLEFLSCPEAGTGLGALSVRCTACGAERSLEGITSGISHSAFRCSAAQPWVRRDKDVPPSCSSPTHVLQRGASNLYFAEVRSAIDIPPDSDHDPQAEDLAAVLSRSDDFEVVQQAASDTMRAKLMALELAKDHGATFDKMREAARTAAAGVAASNRHELGRARATGDLRRDEWHALRADRPDQDPRSHFVTRREPLVGDDVGPVEQTLADRLLDVVLVTRLREVRALKSFRRYSPESAEIRPALDAPCDWLPAIEVFGEGVFLSFAEEPLQEWEKRAGVLDRVNDLEPRRQGALLGKRLPPASPRFVLLHTFAHLLIRRLAFECGYTAASLRERIYCAEADSDAGPFAGVLVYTAAGDAEGTLGGLVRQGRAPRMTNTILAMLQDASWCSSDPICVESTGQGFQALNLGACHACALLAETSCEHANALLDRAVLTGAGGVGYFGDVLDAALNATKSER